MSLFRPPSSPGLNHGSVLTLRAELRRRFHESEGQRADAEPGIGIGQTTAC